MNPCLECTCARMPASDANYEAGWLACVWPSKFRGTPHVIAEELGRGWGSTRRPNNLGTDFGGVATNDMLLVRNPSQCWDRRPHVSA